jgi:tRNA nucleotidyltransferase (CCA-adding enzyme)
MDKKIKAIFNQVLKEVKPSKEEIKEINFLLNRFISKLNKKKIKNKIDLDIFIGGSFAKNTFIKKDKYDIDIFLRFDSKYKNQDISKLTYSLLKDIQNLKKIHGSRDYFIVKIKENLFFEIIPTLKIKKSKEYENITDLSYFHVGFINKKIKNEKILDEIRIAKSFCYSNKCYGAESYIKGFSGYSLELLIYHYKSFLKLIKEFSKKNEKIIIDPNKLYKTKKEILMNLNSSKLKSPVILIDPTNKNRNALAALSYETFNNFKKICENFLKKPSINYFKKTKVNFSKIKNKIKKKNLEFILLKISTSKQEGDIAGGKLLKFYKYLKNNISEFFLIKNSGFLYEQKKDAEIFFITKSKKEVIKKGPMLKDKKNIENFKKINKECFEKKDRIYSKKIIDLNLNQFLDRWKIKNKNQIKDMNITNIKILDYLLT